MPDKFNDREKKVLWVVCALLDLHKWGYLGGMSHVPSPEGEAMGRATAPPEVEEIPKILRALGVQEELLSDVAVMVAGYREKMVPEQEGEE